MAVVLFSLSLCVLICHFPFPCGPKAGRPSPHCYSTLKSIQSIHLKPASFLICRYHIGTVAPGLRSPSLATHNAQLVATAVHISQKVFHGKLSWLWLTWSEVFDFEGSGHPKKCLQATKRSLAKSGLSSIIDTIESTKAHQPSNSPSN